MHIYKLAGRQSYSSRNLSVLRIKVFQRDLSNFILFEVL